MMTDDEQMIADALWCIVYITDMSDSEVVKIVATGDIIAKLVYYTDPEKGSN